MMTLDEMKLAVCEKLPELIEVGNCHIYFWKTGHLAKVKINWPTEGLQVCHEASQKMRFQVSLLRERDGCWSVWISRDGEPVEARNNDLLTAWLEALCRVWWPERFV